MHAKKRKNGSTLRTTAVTTIVFALTFGGSATAYGNEPSVGEDLVEATVATVAEHYEDLPAAPELIQGGESDKIVIGGENEGERSFTVVAPESDFVQDKFGNVTEVGDSAGSATFVDIMPSETRIITTVTTAGAAQDLDFKLQGIQDPYLVPMEDGSFKILDDEDRYVVDLGAPWAVDATGKYLETSYTLDNSVLTQKIDYTDAVFPVVSDPAWNYYLDHGLNGVVAHGKEKATPKRVMAELRRCFNCSFPVAGAPKAFPKVGQLIPLDASPFTCIVKINAAVKMNYVTSTTFAFIAAPGHFDGAGSTISFTFYNDKSGYLHLAVGAHILKDNGAVANEVNKRVASQTWLNFLGNLIRRNSL
ncbi:hypothetical protein ACIQLK_05715 [Microbacterium sp. NPDC091382]|uniref:hypothetical protein n=1 Tax=Microbacterium sp. NPDC091382 TaxID=3364210 RepID=UPI0037FF43C0